MKSSTIILCWLLSCCTSSLLAFEAIPRRLPPIGIEIPQELREQTNERLSELATKVERLKTGKVGLLAADADVLLKSVRLAVEQREIYRESQLKLLSKTLDLAEQRIEQLGSEPGNASSDDDFRHQPLTVRGFYSRIDGSPQPYGLVIPEGALQTDSDTRLPLYVWLHGRGDRTTDIHFIKERLTKKGQITPPDAFVLHPFGRQCIGFKSAGETDVFEAIQHVLANYNVDPDRVVLMGFSMGGAGAWHIGAHFTDQFLGVSPGAGFAETSKYQKLSAEQIGKIPSYERRLWGQYDVPNYARNFLKTPLVCYSGEKDKQMQAALVMEAALQQHDMKLDHVIGPGMGHKYHPDSLSEIMDKMAAAVSQGKQIPTEVHLQTQTLRYARMHWVHIDRLVEHWNDSRVDAKLEKDTIAISTKNVAQLTIEPIPKGALSVTIDGDTISITSAKLVVSRPSADANAHWKVGELSSGLAKRPGLQGPIDDAFVDRFLVVTPSKPSGIETLDKWAEFELQHLRDRWSALFRAKLPEKMDTEVTEKDIRESNLVVFGDPASNSVYKRIADALQLEAVVDGLWRRIKAVGGASSGSIVPTMVYPNPLNPNKYIVLNSGPTFRESHDRTNSLQNPKLPDWAILDISTPPNGEQAGKVLSAGFFDENWQFK